MKSFIRTKECFIIDGDAKDRTFIRTYKCVNFDQQKDQSLINDFDYENIWVGTWEVQTKDSTYDKIQFLSINTTLSQIKHSGELFVEKKHNDGNEIYKIQYTRNRT
jgi:hypothetical protein